MHVLRMAARQVELCKSAALTHISVHITSLPPAAAGGRMRHGTCYKSATPRWLWLERCERSMGCTAGASVTGDVI